LQTQTRLFNKIWSKNPPSKINPKKRKLYKTWEKESKFSGTQE